jgi:hypothetical protein
MDDAREHLSDCVKDLQTFMTEEPSRVPASVEQDLLETYDRFRHELGILLRECERGKSVLLDILESRRKPQHGADEADGQAPPSHSGHVRTHPTSGSSKDSYDNADIVIVVVRRSVRKRARKAFARIPRLWKER